MRPNRTPSRSISGKSSQPQSPVAMGNRPIAAHLVPSQEPGHCSIAKAVDAQPQGDSEGDKQ